MAATSDAFSIVRGLAAHAHAHLAGAIQSLADARLPIGAACEHMLAARSVLTEMMRRIDDHDTLRHDPRKHELLRGLCLLVGFDMRTFDADRWDRAARCMRLLSDMGTASTRALSGLVSAYE